MLRERKVPNPTEGYISHESPGRLRIKFPVHKGDENFFTKLGKRLLSCPGVQKIEANPSTGSVLLLHESDTQAIVEFARGKKIFHLSEPKKGESPVHQNLISSFAGLNERVKSAMSGQVDLWGITSLLLIGAGVYQVARGNLVAIPWYTALYYGSNILLKSRDGGSE